MNAVRRKKRGDRENISKRLVDCNFFRSCSKSTTNVIIGQPFNLSKLPTITLSKISRRSLSAVIDEQHEQIVFRFDYCRIFKIKFENIFRNGLHQSYVLSECLCTLNLPTNLYDSWYGNNITTILVCYTAECRVIIVNKSNTYTFIQYRLIKSIGKNRVFDFKCQ